MRVHVSLTCISSRLDTLAKVIDSLLSQTRCPDQIWLNVSRDPYLLDQGIQEHELRMNLPNWISDSRLRVQFVTNTGPYRKLVPTLNQVGKGDVVVTADDDVIYPKRWLEGLLWVQRRYPSDIIAYRARRMTWRGSKLSSYLEWPKIQPGDHYVEADPPDFSILPTGCYGVLYPVDRLPPLIQSETAQSICPTSDDIWFRMITLCQRIPVRIVSGSFRVPVEFKNASSIKQPELSDTNLRHPIAPQNDIQMHSVLNYLKSQSLDPLFFIPAKKRGFLFQMCSLLKKRGSAPKDLTP